MSEATGDPGATHAIQRAIRDSGLSLNQIARETGINVAAISRFMRGERTLTLETAERLIDFFGMRLSEPTRHTDEHTAEATEPIPTARPMGKLK